MNMKRLLTAVLLATATVLAIVSCSDGKKSKVPSEVTLSKEVLMDKIKGAWAGQIIGCT